MRDKFFKLTLIVATIIAACSELTAQTDLRTDVVGEWVSDTDTIAITKIYRVKVKSLLIDNSVEDLSNLDLVSEIRAKAKYNNEDYILYEVYKTNQVLFDSKSRIFVTKFIHEEDTLEFDNKIFRKKQ